PVEARTHLLLYGSTESPARITASAPAASAVRSTVPALPGSRTLARITTSRGDPATRSASGTSMNGQTASSPCGVTVCASSAISDSSISWIGAPTAATASTSSSCLVRASPVTNNSLIPVLVRGDDLPDPPDGLGLMACRPPSASRTACGPSARNSLDRSRIERLASSLAALTRDDLAFSIPLGSGRPWCVYILGQRLARYHHERRERGRVVDGQIGQHLAVHVHARDLQALDEPVISNALGPRRRVDPLDPQPAERALAVLAVPVGVGHGVKRLLLGLAIQPGSLAPVPACPLENYPALLVGIDRPLYACHFLWLPNTSDRVTCPAASLLASSCLATGSLRCPVAGSAWSACAQSSAAGSPG